MIRGRSSTNSALVTSVNSTLPVVAVLRAVERPVDTVAVAMLSAAGTNNTMDQIYPTVAVNHVSPVFYQIFSRLSLPLFALY